MTGQTLKYARVCELVQKNRDYQRNYQQLHKEEISEKQKKYRETVSYKKRVKIIDHNWKTLGYFIEPK